MSYLVLARKYRPQKFADLLGQEVIAQTLLNALEQNRTAHAFLFTGPRGVGKTSCARILTKAVNCLNPKKNEPCDKCNLCESISENVCSDVFEIDAASNRGIEHIRNLKENCLYPPASAKFKIFIIDEVHMLTVESFNALLKTLEEPPPYVKFILATTDSQKIPPTVISRCQRFDFRSFTFQVMVDYLKKIATAENIQITEKTLQLIVRDAKGGMRDALTLTDMLIAFSGNKIEETQASKILGLSDPQLLLEFIMRIFEKNSAQTFQIFSGWLQSGISLSKILGDLLEMIKDLSLLQSIPGTDSYWKEHLPELLKDMENFSKTIPLSSLNQFFEILMELDAQFRHSEFSKICFEMAILKLLKIEQLVGIKQILSALKKIKQDEKKNSVNFNPQIKLNPARPQSAKPENSAQKFTVNFGRNSSNEPPVKIQKETGSPIFSQTREISPPGEESPETRLDRKSEIIQNSEMLPDSEFAPASEIGKSKKPADKILSANRLDVSEQKSDPIFEEDLTAKNIPLIPLKARIITPEKPTSEIVERETTENISRSEVYPEDQPDSDTIFFSAEEVEFSSKKSAENRRGELRRIADEAAFRRMKNFILFFEGKGEGYLLSLLRKSGLEEFSGNKLAVVCSLEQDFKILHEKKRTRLEEMLSECFHKNFEFHCRFDPVDQTESLSDLHKEEEEKVVAQKIETLMNSETIKTVRSVFPDSEVQFFPAEKHLKP